MKRASESEWGECEWPLDEYPDDDAVGSNKTDEAWI